MFLRILKTLFVFTNLENYCCYRHFAKLFPYVCLKSSGEERQLSKLTTLLSSIFVQFLSIYQLMLKPFNSLMCVYVRPRRRSAHNLIDNSLYALWFIYSRDSNLEKIQKTERELPWIKLRPGYKIFITLLEVVTGFSRTRGKVSNCTRRTLVLKGYFW